jgi:hypothetical protein
MILCLSAACQPNVKRVPSTKPLYLETQCGRAASISPASRMSQVDCQPSRKRYGGKPESNSVMWTAKRPPTKFPLDAPAKDQCRALPHNPLSRLIGQIEFPTIRFLLTAAGELFTADRIN